jgi:hypothetical protein
MGRGHLKVFRDGGLSYSAISPQSPNVFNLLDGQSGTVFIRLLVQHPICVYFVFTARTVFEIVHAIVAGHAVFVVDFQGTDAPGCSLRTNPRSRVLVSKPQ